MEREWVIEESVVVAADPSRVYDLVADVRRTGEWSPECFKVLARGRGAQSGGPVPEGTKFVGFNRIGPRVWFTNSVVTAAEPGRAFAFRVSSFGVPVALWGFRIDDVGDGGTRLTQYWHDQRRDSRGAAFISVLGRIFTGVAADDRAEQNRAGMRASLGRIKELLEGVTADRS